MTKELTAAVATALNVDTLRPAWFVSIEFDGSTLYVWSGLSVISWNAIEWQPVGGNGFINEITETEETRSQGIELQLSGVPASQLVNVLGAVQIGKTARVWLGLFDADWTLIVDPIDVFQGKTDVPRIEDSGDTSSVTIRVESRMVDLQRGVERRFTDEDQKSEYPGDLGFEHVEQVARGRFIFAGRPVDPPEGLNSRRPASW